MFKKFTNLLMQANETLFNDNGQWTLILTTEKVKRKA